MSAQAASIPGPAEAGPAETDPAIERFRERRRRDHRRARVRTILVVLAQVAIVGAFVLAWQLAIVLGLANPTFVGTPREMLANFWEKTLDGTFLQDAIPTFSAVLVAFALSSVVGTFVGILMSEFTFVNRVLQPLVALVNSVPRIALAALHS